MAEIVLGPNSLVFGYKRDRCLVLFETLLPVCSSRRLGALQSSFGPAISADESGNVFTLNTDKESIMVINSSDYNKMDKNASLNWNQLVIVRNAVGLAVGDMSAWVVTSLGDISFIRLRKGTSVRAATQKLIKPELICEDATEIICAAVSETDRVFVGIRDGRIYCSSGTYTKWYRLPGVNRRSSWGFFNLFRRNVDDTIHCMAACVNALYCCIGSDHNMWRFTSDDALGNGTWHHMKLTNLHFCSLSVSRDGLNVLLGVDSDGTLFVYRDSVDFNDRDWVEVSSESWLSVAIGHGLTTTSDSSDNEAEPMRKKTVVATTMESQNSSDDEYFTARNSGFSRRHTTLKTTLKSQVRQLVQRSTPATGRQSTQPTHSSVFLQDIPFKLDCCLSFELIESCLSPLQEVESIMNINSDIEQFTYDFKLEKGFVSSLSESRLQKVSSVAAVKSGGYCDELD